MRHLISNMEIRGKEPTPSKFIPP